MSCRSGLTRKVNDAEYEKSRRRRYRCALRPGSQQKGVGRYMMDYADELARDLGCTGMWLVSGFGREEEAHDFYKRLGYAINGYRFIRPF